MGALEFRLLGAEEISIRIGSVKETGMQLLLYKNARCDMDILDETVGKDNWQRRHYECKGNLFASVGIRVVDAWIWKDDAGAESNTEKEKGEASDSFKRACVNWGIGRELYTSPFIWVPSGKCTITNKKSFDKFHVEKIAYSDKREIVGISIVRDKNREKAAERVFVWSKKDAN